MFDLKQYRHKVISSFLNKVLEIDEEQSELSANAIEASVSEGVLAKLTHFFDYAGQCACKSSNWAFENGSELPAQKKCGQCRDCSSCNSDCSSCSGGCR